MNNTTSLVRVEDLDRVFALDREISSENMPQVVEQTISLWRKAHESGTLIEIIEWGLIYSLRTTVIIDGPHAGKAKWQVTQLRDHPLARTWVEFCEFHLGMSPSEASNKKRNWEIYHIELGYPLIDMMIAGVQRLNVARGVLTVCLKGSPPVFPENLLVGVFGIPHECLACGEVVSFLENIPPKCPSCEADYQYREPLTVSAVKAIIEKLSEKTVTRPHVEADIEQTDDALTVLPYFVDSEGQRHPLPAWDIPIVQEGQYASLGGISADRVGELARWIKARFPGMAK